jgi:uncharacterized protein YacL
MIHFLRTAGLVLALGALGALVVVSDGAAPWWAGGLLGLACGAAVVGLDAWLADVSRSALVGGVAGLAAGLVLAALVRAAASPALAAIGTVEAGAIAAVLAGSLAWLGASVGARRSTWPAEVPGRANAAANAAANARGISKVVDTSIIIDGRIIDIIMAGFIEGTIVIPQFVLKELQQVADSSDPLKRNRGRKGLDVLRAMQESARVRTEFTAEDTAEVRDVDAKLLWLADRRGAKILTNDYNLNKVAQLRGIEVLNVNDLANAMKPVVLPGEPLAVQVIKEGKERNQGVGYLDDGTMVVVENGRRLIGQKLDVTVTSVIQTNAGKMIFAQPANEEPEPRPRVVRRLPDGPTVVLPPPAVMPHVPHIGES